LVVKQFNGRGRTAVARKARPRGGFLFRLYMRWFARGGLRP
jgi:hypothetical protein